MIYVPSLRAPFVPAAERAPKTKPSFFALVVRALMESRQRKAERVIAAMIERHGGRLTDELERRIADHLSPVSGESFGRKG